jgi:CubicO group peptidase (beta-lactamase class C family)
MAQQLVNQRVPPGDGDRPRQGAEFARIWDHRRAPPSRSTRTGVPVASLSKSFAGTMAGLLVATATALGQQAH